MINGFSLLIYCFANNTLHADSGDFSMPKNWVIAHVAQESPSTERSAIDYVIDGDGQLRAIEGQLEQANENHQGELLGKLYAQLEEIGGYTANSRAAQLLSGLGFSQTQLNNPVNSFSGGWRMRLNLAKALMCRSDLLLLDEPTNDLDIPTLQVLEENLVEFGGAIVLITHDRYMLQKSCNAFLALEPEKEPKIYKQYSEWEAKEGAPAQSVKKEKKMAGIITMTEVYQSIQKMIYENTSKKFRKKK